MSRHVPKYVHGTKLYEEALKRIAELEADCEKAWTAYDQILEDRNALLDQLNKGPLSSDEWQLRAIRAEAERDQLAAGLKAEKREKLEWMSNSAKGAASLETARKALEDIVTVGEHTHIWRHIRVAKQALAQIAKPAAAQDYCETDDVAETLRKEDALEERAVAASDHFRDTAKMVAPDGKDAQHDALEERDRAVAKRCSDIAQKHGSDEEAGYLAAREIRREFGLEE